MLPNQYFVKHNPHYAILKPLSFVNGHFFGMVVGTYALELKNYNYEIY
jgi:hypothetical protein